MKLVVKDIHKSFGEKEVLHGINFSVESGKALGLLGRNGAGKTTTIRILMDVFHANSGEITMDGHKFNPQKYQIGYLPEEILNEMPEGLSKDTPGILEKLGEVARESVTNALAKPYEVTQSKFTTAP